MPDDAAAAARPDYARLNHLIRTRGGNRHLRGGWRREATRSAASLFLRGYIDLVLLTSGCRIDDPHCCLTRFSTGMIGACWHHRLTGLLLAYRDAFGRGWPACDTRDPPSLDGIVAPTSGPLAFRSLAMISASEDGELIARVFRDCGGNCIRGSSSRDAAGALRSAAEELARGAMLYVTPDGPRGPKHSVQHGVIELARISGCPVVPISSSFGRLARFERSWDGFELPLPFGRFTFHVGAPVLVAPDTPRDTAREAIRAAMLETTARADAVPAKLHKLGKPRNRPEKHASKPAQ